MIPTATQTSVNATIPPANDGPKLGAGADFDTFLTLLTTQLKNQDPLNPLEGHEFAAQLATFTGVEQQAFTNKLLGQMMTLMGGNELVHAAGWIGKEARTTDPVRFDDTPLTLEIEPVAHADQVDLVVFNSSGLEVGRESIAPQSAQIVWFGRDSLGDKLPDDHYYFRTVASRDGAVISENDVGVYARIESVRRGPNGAELVLANGDTLLASQIDALRNADGS